MEPAESAKQPVKRKRRPRSPARGQKPAVSTTKPEALEPAEAHVEAEAEAAERASVQAKGEALEGPPAEEVPSAQPAARELYDILWDTGLPNVATLARKELSALFLTPIAYVVGALVIALTSLFGFLPQINGNQPVAMVGVFNWLALMMVFFTPLYTMRLLAEEQRSGTLEQLMTSPIRFWELVAGKWLGAFLFFAATIATTLVYVVLISTYQQLHTPATILGFHMSLPNVDYGAIFTGYVGILLLGASWVALGLLASSLTHNQIIAAVIGILVLIVLQYGFGVLAGFATAPFSDLFEYLSASNRAQSFNHGQIVLRDLLYFVTLTAGTLFVTTRVVESRKWR